MLLVVVAALAASFVKWTSGPISRTRAIALAEQSFLKFPGTQPWKVRYRARAWLSQAPDHRAGGKPAPIWFVDFFDTTSGDFLAQVVVTGRGEAHAPGINTLR